ncbi:hypothetical protein CVM73_33265 [Bradyrhizobium forestalis]|uniref:Uncharacterized protein n=1 Tax=Bradyrhizobium forestalis TaxID=1419263 RepID=A0A2M8QZQ5_9BRAD|nr:hypothetical protein CVM73_33265 [Bradyrhizobium forestalis]
MTEAKLERDEPREREGVSNDKTLVPRTQPSVSLAMRSIVQFDDALQSRGPCNSDSRGDTGSRLCAATP